MKQLGYYYSKSLKTILIGFIIEHPHQNREQLVGMVIGHTYQSHWGHAFNIGYKYKQWTEDFIYVGRLTTFTTLDGYMSFLKNATSEEIEAYFKIKSVVLGRHCSQVIEEANGFRYRITFNPKLLSLT